MEIYYEKGDYKAVHVVRYQLLRFHLHKKLTSKSHVECGYLQGSELKMEKLSQVNGPKKRASVDILIPDNIDFNPKLIGRDREGLTKARTYQGHFNS